MLLILILTGKCQLNCRYCGGSIDESIMPPEISYDMKELVDFINSLKRVSIAFYGGEPLLRMDLIKKIMDEVDAEHFILQTNGLMLSKLEREYIQKFSTILVSIDGRKSVTEYYRGKIYDRVLEEVKRIRGFYKNELIARMVASLKTDIYEDVVHLLNLGLFTHVHWQIDAVWNPYSSEFLIWLERYKKGITKLAALFNKELKKGRILGIVPFLGVLKAMIFEENPKPPCGSGTESFAITTDGKIIACPIAAEFDWNIVGDLQSGIRREIDIKSPCPECDCFKICGGRCLFTNRERLWDEEGFKMLCNATIYLIKEMKKTREIATNLSEKGVLNLNRLYYPKFNNTTEIIP